jgi:hypothetical protein
MAAAVSEPAIYRILTFQVPNLGMLWACTVTIATPYEKKRNKCYVNKTHEKGTTATPKTLCH